MKLTDFLAGDRLSLNNIRIAAEQRVHLRARGEDARCSTPSTTSRLPRTAVARSTSQMISRSRVLSPASVLQPHHLHL